MRKINKIPPALANINLKHILRLRGIYVKVDQHKELTDKLRPIAKEIIGRRKVKAAPIAPTQHEHPKLSHDEIIAYAAKQVRIIHSVEERFDLKLRQFIHKMVDGFVKQLETELSATQKGVKKDYFSDNEDELLAEAQFDFTPLLNDLAAISGNQALDLIKSEKVYDTTSIRDIISRNVAKFTQSMIDTDRQTLINIITDGVQNGHSVNQIRDQIVSNFDTINKNQAMRISRTEVSRTSVQSAIDAWDQSGVVEGLQWVTDGTPCPECAPYEGLVEAIDSNGFYSGDTEFDDGYPPLHPNCYCTLVPITIDEGTKAMRQRISELESKFDKRTKEYKALQADRADDAVYIKALERHLGVDDE